MPSPFPQFPVLSDPEHVAYKAFSVGKSMFGLTDARTTFIIDGKGVVRYSTLSYAVEFTPYSMCIGVS